MKNVHFNAKNALINQQFVLRIVLVIELNRVFVPVPMDSKLIHSQKYVINATISVHPATMLQSTVLNVHQIEIRMHLHVLVLLAITMMLSMKSQTACFVIGPVVLVLVVQPYVWHAEVTESGHSVNALLDHSRMERVNCALIVIPPARHASLNLITVLIVRAIGYLFNCLKTKST